MKRIFLLALILLSLFFGLEVNASTWRFKWENTNIHIPVGDELGKYIDLPKAVLHMNDVALPDAKIDYQRDGDWLYFLKDVNTNRVGEYKVWYKAFEKEEYNPGTCNGYKQIITFIVEDTIAPEVVVKSKELTKKRQSEDMSVDLMYEFLKANIEAKDNYSDCTITFNHDINLKKIGRYKVEAFATDTSKNVGQGEFYVNVLEGNAPSITYLGEGNILNLPVGSSYNIKELFKAFDEVDGDISDSISIPSIDTSKIGTKSYTISVFNKAGQKATFDLTVNVLDDEAPVITLFEDKILLAYNTDFSTYDFMKHIKEIKDNMEVDYTKVEVSHDLKNEVGSYKVKYLYTDGINRVEAILEVTLIANESPIIEVREIVIPRGTKIDFKAYINVVDSSDPNIMDSLVIDDSKVDYDKPGTYEAEAYCINSSGLAETKRFSIVIEDTKLNQNGGIISGNPVDYTMWIIGGMLLVIVLLLGFIIYYFVIRKKRNTL